MSDAGGVRELWRYPVSSFGGERLERAEVSAAGISGDRRGAFFETLSGSIVNPSVVRQWNIAPRMLARIGPEGAPEVSLDGSLWRATGDAGLAADIAGFCGTPIAFKPYGAPHGEDVTRQRYAWKPVHLISTQALAVLQAHLPGSRIDPRRFRPNIVVDLPGPGGRMPELALIGREFGLGPVRLRGIEASGRCSFTTLEQPGLPEDRAVLRGLIAGFGKNFGIYCEVLVPGEIALGDALELPPDFAPDLAPDLATARPAAPVHAEPAGSTVTDAEGAPDFPAPTRRLPLGKIADTPLQRVQVAGLGPVVVMRESGEVFAADDLCPHAATALSQGFVENGRIVCPVHFAEFDPRTGQPFNAPKGCGRLRCYPVVRQGDELFLMA